jgi:hypothetical protein
MVVPVLGAVDRIMTRSEARARALKRGAAGLSGLAIAGAVSFVTWAWANDAQLLSPDLRQAIEVLREALR